MKKYFLILGLFLFINEIKAQDFNSDKTAFSNFVKRMYESTNFEGVKIVEDYNSKYLISLVVLEKAKYSSSSTMNRVANVKARSNANIFVNGSNITSDMIIKTSETKDSSNNSITSMEEIIKENANGFIEGMELLNSFDSEDGKQFVYIVYRELKSK